MDYTEKVLEYFRNPKNMGRIENADGIGKVGNPVCLYPDEKIILKDGIIPISQIEEGIYVFTHKGNYEKVLKLYKRFYKGKILILKNKIGEIKLTPDHILFGIKIPEGDKYKRTKWKKELMPGWYHASQLKKGDIIAYPILKEKVENEYVKSDDWFDEDYFFTPLRKIEEINYSGPVYNIEVENAHSFVSEGFTLHNCGDVMWIYIKVGKNEKGEEIIEDIKFETFGCAAAIATSSVVTELAKGKTLKEAEKISNKDVVEFLGGLPPIKKHCSLLAEEGLKAAIDDYYKKNERKRESG
jgi:nitrogen fixation NifU-like protein